TFSTYLAYINNQFSYILRVPFESLAGSATLSPNTLRLNTARTTYLRANVSLFAVGSAVPIPLAVAGPSLGSFDFGASDRGRVEQVNLLAVIAIADSDGDGIPDSWMMHYFGHASAIEADLSRATDDYDNDGATNWEEYIAGTDPTDDASFFAFTDIVPDGETSLDKLQWQSSGNRLYSVYGSPAITGLPGSFSLISSNIVATPPRNTFTNTVMPSARFYRVEVFKLD
ncbi:MAG: hypothetical protein KJ072_22400, partial [Verrucomicrobia bacterium]|nr:hypothetical protein [Verrucomicrobiota bacterium]